MAFCQNIFERPKKSNAFAVLCAEPGQHSKFHWNQHSKFHCVQHNKFHWNQHNH